MVNARAKDAVRGPLVLHADGLAAALAAGGYTSATQTKYHRLLIELSGWLARRGIDAAGCTEETLERYVAARRAGGHTVAVSVAGLGPLLGYLRDRAAIPPAPPPPPDPVAPVLSDYRRYLERERRLAPLTVTTALGVVRRFLVDRRIADGAGLAWLTVDDVHAFVLTEANRLSIGATRATLGALRPFLRYLFATGMQPRDLAVAVPAVAGSRLASLPRALDAATVRALLAGCDRRRPVGRRDFAILTLQARLGLRANEVAALRLDDIDWRAGELTICGSPALTDT